MVPQNQKLLVVIDGFDMFYDIEQIREKVIPERLPENIKLIFHLPIISTGSCFLKKALTIWKLPVLILNGAELFSARC